VIDQSNSRAVLDVSGAESLLGKGDMLLLQPGTSAPVRGHSGADFFRRKLTIGYSKATAYVEQLEGLGFLGQQKGTSVRESLKTWD
jgi:DNA segregation ATPase FtsK/SpoIIIE-like protein